LDIEFENEWEATSDWKTVMEGRESCCPHLRGQREGEGEGNVEKAEKSRWICCGR